jgi:hypothetical protein
VETELVMEMKIVQLAQQIAEYALQDVEMELVMD